MVQVCKHCSGSTACLGSQLSCFVRCQGQVPAPDVPASRRTVVLGLSCGLLPLGVLWGLPPSTLSSVLCSLKTLVGSPLPAAQNPLSFVWQTHTAPPRAVVQLHKAPAPSQHLRPFWAVFTGLGCPLVPQNPPQKSCPPWRLRHLPPKASLLLCVHVPMFTLIAGKLTLPSGSKGPTPLPLLLSPFHVCLFLLSTCHCLLFWIFRCFASFPSDRGQGCFVSVRRRAVRPRMERGMWQGRNSAVFICHALWPSLVARPGGPEHHRCVWC